MIQAITLAKLLLGIAAEIIDLVKKVEIPGNGADKLATIIAIVKEALDLVAGDLVKALGQEKVDSYVGKVVAVVVGLFNKVGLFAKTG